MSAIPALSAHWYVKLPNRLQSWCSPTHHPPQPVGSFASLGTRHRAIEVCDRKMHTCPSSQSPMHSLISLIAVLETIKEKENFEYLHIYIMKTAIF